MIYVNINYSVLKDYIQQNKEQYNIVDILYLLNCGYINQQQYEDLITIISKPQYNYQSFLLDNKQYYHQQGPLSQMQILHDIFASNINKSRLKRR